MLLSLPVCELIISDCIQSKQPLLVLREFFKNLIIYYWKILLSCMKFGKYMRPWEINTVKPFDNTGRPNKKLLIKRAAYKIQINCSINQLFKRQQRID